MKFLEDPFVIQCFDESSLPRDPAGRVATITEWVQSGMITLKEGRRLMRVPMDLEQNEHLNNASEERIFKYLDDIVESGKYTPPDAFMDLALAEELVVQYYNLYVAAKLEESKAQKLRDFFTQIQTLKQAAMPPPVAAPGAAPPANPMPTPVSPLIPNTNAAPAA
jgi:polyhydroxyalkanoate synthesis regulator phasin